MESGDKKTVEGQTIGQKRKRDDGMNNIVTIDAHIVFVVVNLKFVLQSKTHILNQERQG